ncbi:MAG: winged helix-turn-helix domain-containing protein [Acidimicrobiales bacterium]
MRSPTVEALSATKARRIALAAQGFADPRPGGRVDRRHLRRVFDRTSLIQIDSVNVLVRAHELPAFSRLGPYPRPLLQQLTERHRELFEYWGHAACLLPVAMHPLLRWRMARARREAWGRIRRIQQDKPGYVEAVLAEVRERGPIAASDLVDGGRSKGPWWGWADGKTALEWLFWCGEVTAAGRRRSFERVYDLTERVLPPEVLAAPTPTVEEAHRALLLRSAHALGVGTASDLANYFYLHIPRIKPRLAELVEDGALVPARVEGWRQPAFLHPGARVPRRVEARALLAPFDPLVFERPRVERLFGMRYRIELYTPAPKRIYGYYVLPFLLGDRLVGRVDVKADRKHSTLRVPGAFAEPGVDAGEVADALAEELRSMARWLELEHVTVGHHGDMTRPLRAAIQRTAGG